MQRYRALFLSLFITTGLLGGLFWGFRHTLARPVQLAASISEISYQGRLDDNGVPAEGQYDFQFFLYDASSGGSQVGSGVTLEDVTVTDGYFTVLLDFGDVWDGSALFLQIEVRPGAETGAYNVLSPRQTLTAAPLAAFAAQVPWSGVSGIPAGFADNIDDDTQYAAGTGLTLNGADFSLQGSYQLPQSCNVDQIAKWDGGGWICSDDNIGSTSTGDITAVFAGSGLTGGGTSGDVTLDIDFAGNGSAGTASRSDHLHDDRYYTETELGTSGRSTVHWNNLTNVPGGLADGDDDTTYSAGVGLLLNGTEFAAQGSPWGNVVVVAKSGGDFSSIQAAVDSITDAGAANPYLVWVAPGVYSETVTLKSFINLQGAGQEAVTITSRVGSTSFPPDAATLVLANAVTVRDLSVVNLGTASRDVGILAPPGTGTSQITRVTVNTAGAGTIGYGIFAVGPQNYLKIDHANVIVSNHVDVFGVAIDDGARVTAESLDVYGHTLDDDAFGLYVIDVTSWLTATQINVAVEADDDSYGLYNSQGGGHVSNSVLIARGSTAQATDSRGIYSFGPLTAIDVTAIGEGARFYNYGLQSFNELRVYGGHFEGRGGTGGSSVNAAVGLHTRGPAYLEGVTGIGRDHLSRNQGLDNEGGRTTVVGGYFLGQGGQTAYGIENFGTNGIFTATAAIAEGRNGASGNYGLYNGGPASLYGGAFTGSGPGLTFGTFGINNIFTIGDLKAYNVTARGEHGHGEVWGLRNWLGDVSLSGGSFTAISGTSAYGIDNDTSNASLVAHDVTAMSDTAGANSYAVYNRNTADMELYGGYFVARGGTTVARAIYNTSSGSTLAADNISALATGGGTNQGLRNQNSAITNITNAHIAGDTNNAIYVSSGTVRIGSSQIDGGATRTGGTLTCFGNFDANFAAYTCP